MQQNPRPPLLKSHNKVILSTLALAWAEHSPALHSAKIWAYLHKSGGGCVSFHETRKLLAELAKEEIIYAKNGRYSLERSLASFEESTRRAHISAQKIREARTALFLLQAIPFIKAAAFTGSVAFGAAKETSDIDILCVAKKGRIWTARMGALLWAEFLGRRRERHIRAGRSKLCVNYFAVPGAEIPVKNIASANMLAQAIPFFGKAEFHRFLLTQKWMKEYLCSLFVQEQSDWRTNSSAELYSLASLFVQEQSDWRTNSSAELYSLASLFVQEQSDWHIHSSPASIASRGRPHDAERITPSAHLPRAANAPLMFIKTLLEKLLAGKCGDAVEKICKTWQLARLSRKIAAGGDASHFIATDEIIALHHPTPKNKEVMGRYEQKMKELGLF